MLSQRRLKRLITYNPETGEVLGATINLYSRGYKRVWLRGAYYPLSRVIWQYVHGDLVDTDRVCLLNSDKLDMRLTNLSRKVSATKVPVVKDTYKEGPYYILPEGSRPPRRLPNRTGTKVVLREGEYVVC